MSILLGTLVLKTEKIIPKVPRHDDDGHSQYRGWREKSVCRIVYA